MKPAPSTPTPRRRASVKPNAAAAAAAAPASASETASSAAIKPVKPVVNALQILRCFSAAAEPARAIDIARQLGINQSTCFNILHTLVAEDVVAFDALSKTYTAGIGLTNLVGQFVSQRQRLEVAKPLMRELAGRFSVTATLWRPIGADRIVLVSAEVSPADLRIDMAEGQRLPYLMGASGRIFAAGLALSEAQMHAAFDQVRWAEPLTFEAYWREVRAAKKRGYAIDDGHFARGIMAIAAPIYDQDGDIAFAVSAVMFRNQFDKSGVAKLGKALNELAKNSHTFFFKTIF